MLELEKDVSQEFIDKMIKYFHMIEEDFDNKKNCANVFISLDSLLNDIIENGVRNDIIEKNDFYKVYKEEHIINVFFEIVEGGLELEYLKELEMAVFNIICDNIVEGLKCGDILPKDLKE